MTKAYDLKHFANPGKVKAVVKVVKSYRQLAALIASEQWLIFHKQGSFDKYYDIKHIKSLLSAHYKQHLNTKWLGCLIFLFLTSKTTSFHLRKSRPQ
jgi:hypothetical protein